MCHWRVAIAVAILSFGMAESSFGSVLLRPTSCFDLSQEAAIDYMHTKEVKQKLGVEKYAGFGVKKVEYVGTVESIPATDVHEVTVSYSDNALVEEIERIAQNEVTKENLARIHELERQLNEGVTIVIAVKLRAPRPGLPTDCRFWMKAGATLLKR